MPEFRISLALFAWLLLLSAAVARPAELALDLSPRLAGSGAYHVAVDLEVGGEALVRTEGATADAPALERRLPISVAGTLRYAERLIPAVAGPPAERRPLAVRQYEQAEAVIKVDDSGVAPKLDDSRRLIVVERGPERPILVCPNGPLAREQLDLIDIVGNSAVLHELLPSQPVADGATWEQTSATIAGLLTLDSVAFCEVQSVLEEHNNQFAKVRLAGMVHGTADGAATQQEIRGVYLFDRRLRQITRLNLAVKENRSIGGATPGLDAVAKLQLTIEPVEAPAELSDEALGRIAGASQRPVQNLRHEAPALGFVAEHDRQWFVTSQQRESVTLRRIDQGDLVAQCTISMLPPISAGRATSLEQFQKDITFALGKNFGQAVSSRQWTGSLGYLCYEVVVRGQVDGVPVEWHYFLVSPESGHRLSLAVTIEGAMVERLAEADRALVAGLRLVPPQQQPAQTATAPGNSARANR